MLNCLMQTKSRRFIPNFFGKSLIYLPSSRFQHHIGFSKPNVELLLRYIVLFQRCQGLWLSQWFIIKLAADILDAR